MLKKNKWKVIISSLVILLPMIFGFILWNDLPDTLATHFGVDGKTDGFGSKAFFVFAVPVILLGVHFVCLLVTLTDKQQKEQNRKALSMIFWILPMISLLVSGTMYATAFGREVDLLMLVPILLGVMLVCMGNYLPKVKQNSTLGIKVSWALRNEENWNKTHRFGGKVMVAGGFLMLFTAFLPLKAFFWAILAVIILIAFAPTVYSYLLYRKHQKEGVIYTAQVQSKKAKLLSAVLLSVVLIVVAVLMFTGNIHVDCQDTSFEIHATYWTDIRVEYSEIDTSAYREDLEVGVRTNGYNSARLMLGLYQNDEFGTYTLYAYTGAREFVVLTSGEKTLVIGLKDAKDTQAVYDAIGARIK